MAASSISGYMREQLCRYAVTGNFEKLKGLIESKAVGSALPSAGGESVLEQAVQGGHLPIVQYLHALGVPLMTVKKDGIVESRAFTQACRLGHLAIAQWMVDQGVPPSARDFFRMPAIHHAADAGQVRIVRWLLELFGEDPATHKDQALAVHAAVCAGYCEVVEQFLSLPSGLPALTIDDLCQAAVESDGKAMFHMLISRGAGINHRDYRERTPLMVASARGNMDLVESALELGADVTLRDGNGWTAMHFAIANNNVEILPMLYEAGAPLVGQPWHTNALLHAAAYGSHGCTAWLLSHGLDAAYADENGMTALMLAGGFARPAVARALLLGGADAALVRKDGSTALDDAIIHRSTDTIAILCASGQCPLG